MEKGISYRDYKTNIVCKVYFHYNKKYIKTLEVSTTTTVTKTININLANITKDKLWDAGNRYLYNLVYSNDAIGAQVTVMNWEGDKGGDVIFE